MQDAATATETQALILTPAQAEAVYSAMCELNNVGGRIDVRLANCCVTEHSRGVNVEGPTTTEQYANQSAFATAYGLQQG